MSEKMMGYGIRQKSVIARDSVDPAATRIFAHVTLFSCLFLDKFGFVVGGGYFSVGLPVCIGALLWAAVSGLLSWDRRSFAFYVVVAVTAILSSLLSLQGNVEGVSLLALLLVLILYIMFVLRPSRRLSVEILRDLFVDYVRVFAVLGLGQYFGQFVGLKIVSLSQSFPFLRPFLVEQFYNSNALTAYGSGIYRSNGIFLREPSTLSQLLVVGGLVDVLMRKRYKFLPLYFVAYLTTYSGTGVLSLVVALVLSAMFSLKDAIRLPFIAMAGVAVLFLTSLVAPTIASNFSHRIFEYKYQNTSANQRYLSQGLAWSDMANKGTIVTGNGPGSFAEIYYSRNIFPNPVLKFTCDYGLIFTFLIISYMIFNIWSPRYKVLSLLFLANFQTGGDVEVNINRLFIMLLLCTWVARHAGASAPGVMKRVAARQVQGQGAVS